MRNKKLQQFNYTFSNNMQKNDDLDFSSWIIELNKGLSSFWDIVIHKIDE